MKNQKTVVLAILGVLAVGSLIYGITTPSKIRREMAAQSKEMAPPAPPTGAGGEGVSGVKRAFARSSFELWGRNPFISREALVARRGRFVLTGIAWDEKEPRALVNDRIVSVGSVIDGSRVVRIEKTYVLLDDGVQEFELRVGGNR